MARLSPEELAAARRARTEERQREEEEARRQHEADEQARMEKEAARAAEIAQGRARLRFLRETRQRRDQLESVLTGLYTEMDKLSKKAPADEATELATTRVNDVILRCRELMNGDEFIDCIDPFVPAGERPEHRDVVLVLSQLMQGIARLTSEEESLRRRSESEGWERTPANGRQGTGNSVNRSPRISHRGT